MRMVAGFLLGVATMVMLNTPRGREVAQEVGNLVAEGAMNKLKERKNELLPTEKNHD